MIFVLTISRSKGDYLGAICVSVLLILSSAIYCGWLEVSLHIAPKLVWQNLDYGSIDSILVQDYAKYKLSDKPLVEMAFTPIRIEFLNALAGCYGFNDEKNRISLQSTRSNVVRFRDRNGILLPHMLQIADAGYGAGLAAVTPQICKNIQKADPWECQTVGYFWCPELAKLMDRLLN